MIEPMDLVDNILETRSPKGGGGGGKGGGSSGKSSKSKSKSKGKSKGKVGGGGYFSEDASGTGLYSLPLWLRIVILVLIIMAILFVLALIHYSIKENKRRKATRTKFRWGKVLWQSIKVATLFGLVTWTWKACRGKTKEQKKGVYAKIEEGQQTNQNSSTWVVPAYQPANAKYEPMSYPGYTTAYPGAVGVQDGVPATSSMAPTPAPSVTPAPPPYTQPPPQQPIQTPPVGAAAEYYGGMPAPPTQVAVAPHAPPPQMAATYAPQHHQYYAPPAQ